MVVEEKARIVFEADSANFKKGTAEVTVALNRQRRELEEHGRALDKEILALKRADQPNKERIRSLQSERQALRQNVVEIRAKASILKEEASAAKEAAKQSTVLSTAAQGVGSSFTSAIGPILAFTTAIAAIGTAINSFGDFERSLNTIKAVSGATASEIQLIKQASLDLGAASVFSAQQVVDSFVNLSKAGFTAQESLAAIPGLLDLAAAAGGDLVQTSEIVAGALRGFGLEAGESARVADVLAQAANKSSGDVADFGLAIKQVAPVAKSSNQSIEEITTTLAILADNMIKGGDAGSDLRNLLTRLSGTTKEVKDALFSLGVNAFDAQGKMRPLIDVVLELGTKLNGLPENERLKFAEALAGAENIKTLLTLTGTAPEVFDRMQDSIEGAEGAARLMAETINQGTNTSIEQLGGSVDTLAKKVGENLAPAFNTAVGSLIELINEASKNESFLDLIRIFGDLFIQVGETAGAVINLAAESFPPLKAIVGDSENSFEQLKEVLNTFIIVLKDVELFTNLAATAFERFFSIGSSIAGLDFSRLLDQVKQIPGDFASADAAIKQHNSEVESIRSGAKRFGLGELLAGSSETGIPIQLPGESVQQFQNRLTGKSNRSIVQVRKRTLTTVAPQPGSTKKGRKGGRKGSTRTGHSELARNERDQLQTILEDSRLQSGAIDLQADKLIAGLGIEGSFIDKTALKLKALKDQEQALIQTEKQLRGVTTQTKEALDKKQDAIAQNVIAITKNQTAQQELTNEIERFRKEQERSIIQTQTEGKIQTEAAAVDRFKAQQELRAEALTNSFEAGEIKAQEYYSLLNTLAFESYQQESDLIELRIDALAQEKKALEEQPDSLVKILELDNKITEERAKQAKLTDGFNATITKNAAALQKTQNAIGKSLADGFQRSLSDAIAQALESGDVAGAIKKFGQSLKSILIKSFADAVSQKLSGFFSGIFDQFGKAFTNIAGRGGSNPNQGTGIPGGGILSNLSGIGKLQAGLVGAAGIFGAITSGKDGILGKAGRAASGFATGTAIGSLVAGPLGATVGALIGAGVGLFGGGKDKKKAKEEKKLAKTQAFIDSQLAGADPNNLNDLIARQSAVLNFKSGSSAGVRAKRAASIQLQQLIDARNKAIEEAIKEIELQNDELRAEISLINAKPGEEIRIQRELELKQLAIETQKILDQFKDSEAAKTKILEQEALKRQLIDEQEKKRFEENAQSLDDLLNKRDQISNRNVFTRAKSAEQLKADDLQSIDKDIAAALLTLNEQTKLGFNAPNVAGINQLLQAAQTAGNFQGQLNIQINGAQDPNAVSEEVLRAVTGFFKKNLGVNIT